MKYKNIYEYGYKQIDLDKDSLVKEDRVTLIQLILDMAQDLNREKSINARLTEDSIEYMYQLK